MCLKIELAHKLTPRDTHILDSSENGGIANIANQLKTEAS